MTEEMKYVSIRIDDKSCLVLILLQMDGRPITAVSLHYIAAFAAIDIHKVDVE